MCFCFFQIWFALYSVVVGVKEWRILRLSKERDLKPIFYSLQVLFLYFTSLICPPQQCLHHLTFSLTFKFQPHSIQS